VIVREKENPLGNSLCILGVLCVSVVKRTDETRSTTETQKTPRMHRKNGKRKVIKKHEPTLLKIAE
jgi:hypothetical protein